MTIMQEVKELLEIDVEETIYDNQLRVYIRSGLQEMSNNGVPVTVDDYLAETVPALKDGDIEIVKNWLHLYCLQRLDRTLMEGGTTMDWITEERTSLMYQLKVRYDIEVE